MPSEPDGRLLATLAMVTQLGFIMVACIVTGFLLGLFFDRRFGTSPVLTIVLLLAGIAGGGLAAYRMIMQGIKESSRQDGEEADGKPNGQG